MADRPAFLACLSWRQVCRGRSPRLSSMFVLASGLPLQIAQVSVALGLASGLPWEIAQPFWRGCLGVRSAVGRSLKLSSMFVLASGLPLQIAQASVTCVLVSGLPSQIAQTLVGMCVAIALV